jgi:predicted nucleotide-binding protein
MDDVQEVCTYLGTKPTGATVKEAKAVLDSRRLDGRKLSAMKIWGLIEENENDRLKITEVGRDVVKKGGIKRAGALTDAVRKIAPYRAIVERAAHRHEESLSATKVSAHWYEHFKEDVANNEKVLNDQAICFFHLAEGAGLGSLVVGRKGSPTRFDFDQEVVDTFINQEDSRYKEFTPIDQTFEEDEENGHEVSSRNGISDNSVSKPPKNNDSESTGQGIFVAHGKDKKPLEQLKKILEQFKIPYRVAIDEPNLGRPISSKVRETMRACNCAILIFTADEEFGDKEGNAVWRPSENVIHELGAAGYLYDNRIVIMKEDTVNFPSNFRDIGHISFAKDQLEAKAMEILKELIGFGIVKVST